MDCVAQETFISKTTYLIFHSKEQSECGDAVCVREKHKSYDPNRLS